MNERPLTNASRALLGQVQTWQWDLKWGLPTVAVIVLLAIIWANVVGRRR